MRTEGVRSRIDELAGIGGEELGLLFPGCDIEVALEVVERLRCDMPDRPPRA